MPILTLPARFALPGLITTLAPEDDRFDGCSEHYLRAGMSALKVVEAALVGAPEPRAILDAQCGFGRVTRVLRARYPAATITACDPSRSAADFTAAAFGARAACSAEGFRDLRLDGSFDLIWAGSLLAQLPEHLVRQFLDFAVRHMGPESRLVATSYGEHVAVRLRSRNYGLAEPAARGLVAEYLADGFAYRALGEGPEYGVSLAARGWWEGLLAGSALRLQAYWERGWDRHHDVLVLRRAPASSTVAAAASLDRPGAPPPAEVQAAQDEAGVAGFDEDWYRATFADVDGAVREGTYASGLSHYLLYGWREGRPPFDPERSYARRTPPVPEAWLDGGANRTSEAWFASPGDQAEDAGWYWMAHPSVRARANRLASGDPSRDAYDRLVALLRKRRWRMPIKRALSIGCGFGGLERDLSARGIVRDVDAYDIAPGAIVEAERQARQLGLHRLRYHVADLEGIDLPPESVDAVFAHSSVHHVERLEALYAVVQRTLRPGGVFHLHEYVGPTRFQWTDAQIRLVNGFLDSLPPRLRSLPNGEPKEELRRPTVEEMIAADPSEAVRSAELVAALEPYFDILEHRPLGGALAHLALGGIAQNFDPRSPEDEAILQGLFQMEDAAMADGTIGADFATVTAVPKPVAGRVRRRTPPVRTLLEHAGALLLPARRLLAPRRQG